MAMHSNVVAALVLTTLALLGNASELRARNSKDSQQILLGKGQMAVDQAKHLQMARECQPGPFPYHQRAVHGKDFKEAVLMYALNEEANIGADHPDGLNKILGYARNHDFGYNEAVKSNGYLVPPNLYGTEGDLIPDIQTQTGMTNAFTSTVKAGHTFYNAEGTAPHSTLTEVNPSVASDALFKEDFGQLHEAHSAFLYITSADVQVTDDSTEPGPNVAGMVLIAGTLGGNFGKEFERVKILHAAVSLLSAKSANNPYSASGTSKNLFNKMEAVVASKDKLNDKVAGLTLQKWFEAGAVGDFLYITQFKQGSICKQANCFAEFFAYGGVHKASKGSVACDNACSTDVQKSWNAFWKSQPGFAGFVKGVALKAGISKEKNDEEMAGANLVMEEIQSSCTGQTFSGCDAFKKVCKFDKGFWKSK